jgi:hypothetical protein
MAVRAPLSMTVDVLPVPVENSRLRAYQPYPRRADKHAAASGLTGSVGSWQAR